MKFPTRHLLQGDLPVILQRLKFSKQQKADHITHLVNLAFGNDQKQDFKIFLILQWHTTLVRGGDIPPRG